MAPLGGISDCRLQGYGATVVEILSAALRVSLSSRLCQAWRIKKVPHRLGHFFIAIDISAFIDLNEFRRITGQILRELRASKKAPGQDRIFTAGEKEYYTQQERAKNGIPIGESLQKDITALQAELGLNYALPF